MVAVTALDGKAVGNRVAESVSANRTMRKQGRATGREEEREGRRAGGRVCMWEGRRRERGGMSESYACDGKDTKL